MFEDMVEEPGGVSERALEFIVSKLIESLAFTAYLLFLRKDVWEIPNKDAATLIDDGARLREMSEFRVIQDL